ncbi:MAG: zinc ribbon domain-containing protein [Bacteroidetes bacterium]|nr:zinc ribbon domain-containing protein [Bacteroidota bacterium]
MPVYEYKCKKCSTQYDVFHKGKEIEEDIVCPNCESREHTRLISVTAVSMGSSSSYSSESYSSDSCGSGSCCGGSCGVN